MLKEQLIDRLQNWFDESAESLAEDLIKIFHEHKGIVRFNKRRWKKVSKKERSQIMRAVANKRWHI